MRDTTVVIKTIGRPTLPFAVQSARREGFKVVVVSDGVDIEATGQAYRYCQLGKRFRHYGSMAQNVGAMLVETEFVTYVDDDDELAPGAGDVIRRHLQDRPEVDIWIPGLRFNNGETFGLAGPLAVGTASIPTYRVDVFTKRPFLHGVDNDPLTDITHLFQCQEGGFKIDWFGEVIYLVRPRLDGTHGRGH